MSTLHRPQLSDFSEEERTVLDRIAKRMARSTEELLNPSIFGVQAHWPAWLEANQAETNQTYRIQGKLPQLVKESMHVAVSMTNSCEY